MNAYEVLGLQSGATLDDIKRRYKQLAKENHPDRLHNVDSETKKQKEEYFKRVTVAYHILLENHDVDGVHVTWSDTWGSMKDILINTFMDVATKYMTRKEHHFQVPVTMEEVYLCKQKKLQLFLKDVDNPIVVSISCNKSKITTDIVLEDGEVHQIHMRTKVQEHSVFDFDEDMNVIANIDITWYDYIHGKTQEVTFLDGTKYAVYVPPFSPTYQPFMHESNRFRVIPNLISPDQAWWDAMTQTDKECIIKILSDGRTNS